MNGSSGAATQICSHRFDRRFFALPIQLQERIQQRIDDLGRDLRSFSHQRMQGLEAFRLRVGDYRVIYKINDIEKTVAVLQIGHRSDVYR